MEISIVIPAFNEEKRISETIKKTIEYMDERKDKYEIIVVDDGSKDHTQNIIESFFDRGDVRIVKNESNRGKGFSVKKGFLEAKYELVLFMDADLATPIEEIEKFIGFIEQGYDGVIGSRNLKESNIVNKQPIYRQIMGKLFPLLGAVIVGHGFKDTQCGFKLFKKEVAKKIASLQRFDRFSFDVEQLFIAKKLGCKIKEAPVTWIDKSGSTVNPIRDGACMVLDLFKIRYNWFKGKY